jgi:hypothetical protein
MADNATKRTAVLPCHGKPNDIDAMSEALEMIGDWDWRKPLSFNGSHSEDRSIRDMSTA